MREQQPAPSVLPLVAMMLSGLAAYVVWQFDPGVATFVVPAVMILVLCFWLTARSG